MTSNPNFSPNTQDTQDTKNTSGHKICRFCNAPLPKNSKESLCINCQDRLLFMDVRDYIRGNDVNEFQVAEHFKIPLRTVKNWIKEGRIEYKEDVTGTRIVANIHCSECGAPITFGTLCSKCLKKANRNMEGFGMQSPTEDDKMRFLQNDFKRQ